ncbi:Myeloid-associated differentiation marker-like [Oryzias melastigma]|uniref:Myeloid-associated differentiation marker-like n=1 Tax=Oryzias melastigma TaxID=30732 RepID=A0A834FI58_ORYME|nr:Myeloid-associated differentiation marker-like [Oryzias melastigma]
MASVDLKSVTQPVGIVRMIATVLACVCFSLVASAGHIASSYWAWCMFSWCFCCFFTLLIVILEFTTVNTKLPFAWEDFTAAFAILACLLCLSTSIIYPAFFTCGTCKQQIGATVVSWVCLALYVGEVVLTRLRSTGQNNGFLSTIPGIMKILETFIACIIFTSMENAQYAGSPPMQWCVAVFSLCFIFAIVLVVLSLAQLTSFIPFSFDKITIVYNILATVMYMTAMVIWPLYSFSIGQSNSQLVPNKDKLVVVTVMAVFNVIVYTLDTIYGLRLVFCIHTE